MNAINVIVGADRVTLFTDTAGIDLLGRLRWTAPKVRELPSLRSVIATRGDARSLDALAAILATLGGSYDELRAAAADGRLKAACALLRSRRLGTVLPFDLVVAGWGAKGPAAFIVTNHRRLQGTQPWRPRDVPWVSIMPPVAMTKRMQENPGASMPLIMDLQHKHREPSRLNPEGRAMVGGAVTCTTITEAGVTAGEVMRWPDEIGKPIGGGRGHWRAWRRLVLFCAAVWAATFAAVMLGEVGWLVVGGVAR